MRKITIKLNEQERQELEQQIRAGVRSARELTRARILLLSDQGQSSGQVAQACLCASGTVMNVKKRYLVGGLEAALYDKPRPGTPPKITGDVEAHLVALTCSDPPEGYGQWTLRLLADQLGRVLKVENSLLKSPSPAAPPPCKGEERPNEVRSGGGSRPGNRLLKQSLVALELVESVSHTAVGKVLKKRNSSPGE